jgi:hypothetical protein
MIEIRFLAKIRKGGAVSKYITCENLVKLSLN